MAAQIGWSEESVESLALFQRIVQHAPVGIAFVDREFRFRQINETLARINGSSPSDHLGKTVREVVPALWPLLEPIYDRVLSAGQPVMGVELRGSIDPANPRPRDWLTDFFPVREGDGTIVGIGVIASEITDLKAAQHEVVRMARHERAMLAAMPDLIFELSAEGTHLSFHAPLTESLLVAPADFIGRSVRDVLPIDVAEAYEAAIRRTLDTSHMQAFDYQLSFPDHKRRMYEARMVPKGADAVLVIVRDVTDRHELEERLRQAQKMDAIGRLAGGIAHDFNNLLTVINGYTAMMIERVSDADSRELLNDIAKAGQRAAGLTRQLLMFSRQQMLEPRVVNLNAIVVETERMLRRVIGEDVELVTDLAPELPAVRIDSGQVEQVLVNLSVNARDAMTPGGGRVTIRTGRRTIASTMSSDGPAPGEYVTLSVADTGIGMSEPVRARIFEPFFTTKQAGNGTGLGLAVVFGVVRQNGGFIDVDTALGRGTTVSLFLPAAGEAPAASPATAPDAGAVPRGTESILLVEDDPAVRALTARLLVDWGYRVLQASDGREGVAIMENHADAIELLLTDVVMPRVNGRELAEVARHLRPDMKVLFMSGYTDDEVLRRGVLSAEAAFLMKPFTPRQLAERVRQELDGRHG